MTKSDELPAPYRSLPPDWDRIPVVLGVLNAERTRGWAVPIDAKPGDRFVLPNEVIEIVDERTAKVVDD